MKVYVILGEDGEYSDRDVYVSGVYMDRVEAERAIVDRSAVRRVFDIWHDGLVAALRCAPWKGVDSPARDAIEKSYNTVIPKPEYEGATRFRIMEAELGTWYPLGVREGGQEQSVHSPAVDNSAKLL